jgi:hypothetical protein
MKQRPVRQVAAITVGRKIETPTYKFSPLEYMYDNSHA